jgi:sialic acid synthase SpsE
VTRCYLIAEVGLSHMGDVGRALASVEAFARAGADAIKFQDHRWQVVPVEQPHPSPHVNMTRQVWYEQTAFEDEQWRTVRGACVRFDVDYIVSPFSVEALWRQLELKPRYIKIASGEVTNRELLIAAAACDAQVLISNGMADECEWPHDVIASEWDKFTGARHQSVPKWLRMECRSEYPCAPEHSNLWQVEEYGAERISDHTAGIWFPIAAVARGATMIEKHVHLDATRPHSDSDIALTPDKFREMVDGVRAVEKALYEPSEPDLTEIRRIYLHAP